MRDGFRAGDSSGATVIATPLRELQPILWNDGLRSRIEGNLRRFRRRLARSAAMRAGVAIVVLPGPEGVACVPVCLRAAGLRRHASQYALPGGRVDADEDALSAVRRELGEELGLSASVSEVLGALDDFHTRSGFAITPWVIWNDGPSWELRPAIDEIAELHTPTLREIEHAVSEAPAGNSPDFSLRFSWAEIYAPTAALLYQFSEVGLHGRTTRVANFYQPDFTAR